MKNEELLADAIGGLDEELLFSADRKRDMNDTNKLVVLKNEPETKKKRSFRKFWLPLSACLVLLLAVAVAGATAIIRELRLGETADGKKTVEYVPDSYETVPLTELTGEVVNAPVIMKQRLLRYLAGENLPGDGTSGAALIAFNVEYPCAIYTPFNTIDAAEAYVGYAPIHMPRVDRPTVQIGVYAEGGIEGGLVSANENSEIELLLAGIVAGYQFGETGNAVSAAVIQFGDHYQSGPLIFENSQDLAMAQETKVVGTREFHILRISGQSDGAFETATVFWSENKVQYTLQISFASEEAEAAEALITEWMNAF